MWLMFRGLLGTEIVGLDFTIIRECSTSYFSILSYQDNFHFLNLHKGHQKLFVQDIVEEEDFILSNGSKL